MTDLNRVENLDSIEKLRKAGFRGIDASLEISLFEYNMVWKDLGDGQWLFVHATPNTSGLPDDDDMEFDSTPMSEQDLEWIEDKLYDIASHTGVAIGEWKSQPFCDRIYDAVSYLGFENIFGSSYGGFKIEKG